MTRADDEYGVLIDKLKAFGWADWRILDDLVGERLAEAVDRFAFGAINTIINEAEQMEKVCKEPPCLHAQGLRLATSYIEAERQC